MKFVNRWKIEGTLTTLTPLRIGDGDTIEARKRLASTYLKADTKINTVAIDKYNKPYIPASAIKGNLRTWAENVFGPEEIEIIFGSKDPKELTAKAGKVQFSNSYFKTSEITDAQSKELADWSSDRLTAVSVGIAVDRKTRTASDKKLFHQEYVPEGITFEFEISGNDYEVTDEDENNFLEKVKNYSEVKKAVEIVKFQKLREDNNKLLNDEGIKKLLLLLKGFADGVTIGAETADLDNSWGSLEWNLGKVKRTNSKSLQTWFETDDEQGEIPIEVVETEDWETEPVINASTPTLEMSLSLQCLDDFLVNDPSKTKRDKNEESDRPNHSPLRNKGGFPILPKSSIKGAIRSQAEKILRTMAISQNKNLTDEQLNEQLKRIACYPDDMKSSCPPIERIDAVAGLCLACQLFGASGWKSPMSFTDFIGDKSIYVEKIFADGEERLITKRREFVAIDRFTGGVSGSGKFNADVAQRPLLKGNIGFDKSRLRGDWAIGLLALTFKDLIEGDIRFGFGRAKGFGEILASFDGKTSLTNIFDETEEELKKAVNNLEDTIGGKIDVVS